jgi:hypothetical protein
LADLWQPIVILTTQWRAVRLFYKVRRSSAGRSTFSYFQRLAEIELVLAGERAAQQGTGNEVRQGYRKGGVPRAVRARARNGLSISAFVTSGKDDPMVMTTLEARKTLSTLETLIAVLEQRSGALDRDDLLALRSLRHRRSSLLGLLAVRDIERPKKIVYLELWRDGYMHPREAFANA